MKPLDALRRARWLGALLVSAALAACNGGDDGVSGTLSGTAATGAPIDGGKVEVLCAAGPAPSPATTSAAGAWTVTVSGVTLPCKVKVSGGNLPAGLAYHSIAVELNKVVNVTPLTDLIVANLAGKDPATLTAADLDKITAPAVAAAVKAVTDALSTVNGLSGLGSVNPITVAFSASPEDSVDKLLEALKTAFPDNYDSLRDAAQLSGFSADDVSELSSGGGSSGGGTGGGGTGGGGTPFTSGTGYAIAYTAPMIGIDLRNPVTASFNSTSGALTEWVWPVNTAESPAIGTLSTSELAIDGALTLGRWNGGVLGGSYFGQPALSLTTDAGLHWVVGKPTASPPTTGTATYSVSKATRVTLSNLSVTAEPLTGTVTVDFASGKVGLDMSFKLDGTVFTVKTTGGTSNTGGSEVSILPDSRSEFSGAGQIASSPNVATGSTNTYTAYVRGFFAGNAADQIGLALNIESALSSETRFSVVSSMKQSASGGGGGTGTGGTPNPLLAAANCPPATSGYSLVVQVTVLGQTTASCVPGVTKPASETAFCNAPEIGNALTGGVPGSTFQINSCSYDPTSGVGDVSATVTAGGVSSVSYSVKYTYIPRP